MATKTAGIQLKKTGVMGCVALAAVLTGTALPTNAPAQTTYTFSSSVASTSWLNGANWSSTNATHYPGVPTRANATASGATTDIAAFGALASGNNGAITINFGNSSTNAGGGLSLGAIDLLSTANKNVSIANSTSALAGTLTLNGGTLDGLADTVLVNDSTFSLTLMPTNGTAGVLPMAVALADATNNVVQVNSTGGIEISSVVSGGKLTVNSAGAGAFTLSAPTGNTYTGGTVVAKGKLVVTANTSGSATGTAGVTVGNNTGAATLAGNGIITGLVTTTSTGSNTATIAPGLNTGTTNFGGAGTLKLNGGLSIGAGTNFNFDLASTTAGTSDLITLGTSTLTLSSTLTFNFNLLTANTVATTGMYTLLSGASNSLDLTGVTISSTGLGTFTPSYSVSGGSLFVSFASAAVGNYFGTTGQGVNAGSTTFDTTTADFNTKNDGTGTAKVYDSTQPAVFGGTAGTVTVASGLTVGAGLQFTTTGYELTGGSLGFASGGNTVQVTAATDTATISSALTGTTGLIKAGAGKLILTGANGNTGTFTNGAGTLEFKNGNNNLASLAVTGGTAQIDAGSQVTLTNGSLPVSTGASLIINGTVLNNSTTGLPSEAGAVTVSAGGTVIQQGTGSPTLFLFTGTTPATFQPGSTFVFRDYANASPSVSGRTYTGNLTFDSTGGAAMSTGTLAGSQPFTVNGDLTIGAGVTVPYVVNNTLTNVFKGNVTVNGNLGGANGTQNIAILTGKSLTLGTNGVVAFATGQSLTVNSGGTLTGTGSITTSTATSVSGTLSPATSGTTGTITTGALTLSNISSLAFDIVAADTKDTVALNATTPGALTLGGGVLALSLPNTSATGIDYGATYAIFTGVSGVTGAFGSVTGYDTADFAAGFALNGTEYDLTFTSVPEPTTVAGGVLLIAAGVWSQRRRLRAAVTA